MSLTAPARAEALSPERQIILERQIIALHLGEDVYGVDISDVHSVILPQPLTPVPQMPAYITGILDLRGRLMPVISLRMRFGLPVPVEALSEERIVVVETQGQLAGLSVDAVSQVVRFASSAVEAPGTLIASGQASSLSGIAHVPDASGNIRLILLLDVPRLLSARLEGELA